MSISKGDMKPLQDRSPLATRVENKQFTEWHESRTLAAVSLLSALVFATLLAGGIFLAACPVLLSGTPQRTYNTVITVFGNLCGALCGAAVACGMRAYTTRELGKRTLTLSRLRTFVALGSQKVLFDLRKPLAALAALCVFLSVNQVSSAVQGVYGISTDMTTFTYPTTLIDLEPPTGLTLNAGDIVTVNGGAADYDGTLDSYGIQLTSGVPFLGSVDHLLVPYGWGINALGAVSAAGLLRSGWLPGDANLVRALNASYGSGTLQFSAPAFLPQTVCTKSLGSALRTSLGDQFEEWSLQGICPNATVAAFHSVEYSAGNETFIVPVSCARPINIWNRQAIVTTFFSVNPSGEDAYALADCTTSLTHGSVVARYQESSNELSIVSWNPVGLASYETHSLVRDYTAFSWETSIGPYGSLSLNRLMQNVISSQADPSQTWTKIASIIYAISTTKIFTVVNSLLGGSRYTPGVGTAFNSTLTYTLPVLRIGARGGQGVVLVVLAACLLLSLASLAMQLVQPVWPFNPLDNVSTLVVAQNSPAAIEVAGAFTGDPSSARNPQATMRFGVLPVHEKRLGLSWSEILKTPENGQKYA